MSTNADIRTLIAEEDSPDATHDVILYVQSIKGSSAAFPGTRNSLIFVRTLSIDGEEVVTDGAVKLVSDTGNEGFLILELHEVSEERRRERKLWLEQGLVVKVNELSEIRSRFSLEEVEEGTDESVIRLHVRSLDLRFV